MTARGYWLESPACLGHSGPMSRASGPFRTERAFLWALCLGLCGAASGIPPAPESMVHDEGRILGPDAMEQVGRVLQSLRRDTGVAAFLVTTAVLDTAQAREQMRSLLESWLEGREGVVLVCNRGNGQFGISASPEFWRRHAADETSRLLSETARAMSLPDSSVEKRIQESVGVLQDGIRRLARHRPGAVGGVSGAERRLGLMLASALALALLVIWLAAAARRRKLAAMGGPFWFPEAQTNPRLGGQFGSTLGEATARRPG